MYIKSVQNSGLVFFKSMTKVLLKNLYSTPRDRKMSVFGFSQIKCLGLILLRSTALIF